jgi:hypothetical protein
MNSADIGDLKSVDSLREFVIRGRNIEKLKKRAESFISLVEKQLPGLENKKNGLFLEDIEQALRPVLNGRDIVVSWVSMDDYDMDGIIYTVRRKAKPDAFIICLNRKIVDLLGDDQAKPVGECRPQNSARAKAYARALKTVYLHEISHLLLNHDLTGMRASPVPEGSLEESPLVEMCHAVYQLYSQVHYKQDCDCDLLSFVLAFWPSKEFTRLVMSSLADWRHSDLRALIANRFLMPINSTIQWIAILFCDRFGMHYVRREEVGKECLDYLDYSNNMSSMFADDLFSHKGTAAWHVANDESRQDYKTLETEDALFLCAAFYERKELFSNKKADEIIVVGFGRDRVRDAVAIFNAGAAA